MRIGIVIHSETGNTLQVAERLRQHLQEDGHAVELIRLAADQPKPTPRLPVTLQSVPDVSGMDGLILGAPVWAFALSPVMRAWLEQMKAAPGIAVAIFLTHAMPVRWMGANRAMDQALEACESKGFRVIDTAFVWCWRHPNAGHIRNLSDRFQQRFQHL